MQIWKGINNLIPNVTTTRLNEMWAWRWIIPPTEAEVEGSCLGGTSEIAFRLVVSLAGLANQLRITGPGLIPILDHLWLFASWFQTFCAQLLCNFLSSNYEVCFTAAREDSLKDSPNCQLQSQWLIIYRLCADFGAVFISNVHWGGREHVDIIRGVIRITCIPYIWHVNGKVIII